MSFILGQYEKYMLLQMILTTSYISSYLCLSVSDNLRVLRVLRVIISSINLAYTQAPPSGIGFVWYF